MSLKENQNELENDVNISVNGDNKNENVEAKRNDSNSTTAEAGPTIMKTRSSKRTSSKISDENNAKSGVPKSKKEDNLPSTEKIEVKENLEKTDEEKPTNEPEIEALNGSSDSSVDLDKSVEESVNSSEKESDQTIDMEAKKEFILDSETFMEPLVLQPDEPCPELEFEESDKESENHSPVLSRCTTRRSQNRNIPTPNTPKVLCDAYNTSTEKGSEASLPGPSKNLNETDSSGVNVSMKVQVGDNDNCRDFSDGESELLQSLKSKSSNSSYRHLSSRRSIRSLRYDLHSRNLQDSLYKNKTHNFSSLGRESMERAPSVKRKDRSETPEERKKIKTDSSGFLSKLSSPLSNLKNKFSSTPSETDTPKLTLYRDEKNYIDGDFFDQVEMPQETLPSQNKWCEIM